MEEPIFIGRTHFFRTHSLFTRAIFHLLRGYFSSAISFPALSIDAISRPQFSTVQKGCAVCGGVRPIGRGIAMRGAGYARLRRAGERACPLTAASPSASSASPLASSASPTSKNAPCSREISTGLHPEKNWGKRKNRQTQP